MGMVQGYVLASRQCRSYLDEKMDKQEIIEKHISCKVVKSLGQIERRLDKLEALKKSKISPEEN